MSNAVSKAMRLYAVTDRAWTGEKTLIEQVESALKGGVTCVQLREKELSQQAFLTEAKALLPLCHAYGVPLIVNDNIEVALKSGADGVHIGQTDASLKEARGVLGSKAIIGVSAHTVEEALEAEKNGADYLGVGAIFPTDTKADASAIGLAPLREICSAVSLPVTAIGGIHLDNLSQLKGTGANGVALVSAIFAAPHIQAACRELRTLCDSLFPG